MKLKYTFEAMKMDDQIVAVPIGDNAAEFHGIIKLNESAAAIFELLSEETAETEITERLLERYSCEREQLEAKVHKYLAQLEADGLLA